ncbi:MAG: DUF3043 domain-containing protein [Actinomycetaceae bacterium]|nr:DUF3043 domain-containing protein [Actinomycetaceae bacterium]
MFSRRSSTPSPEESSPTASEESQKTRGSQKKGRPTRSRREAEAARFRPLVPADRKQARKEARAKRDEAYRREQEALVTGDDRYLPYRDKGPIRRFIRDYVDARRSFSELFMPVVGLAFVAIIITSFIPQASTFSVWMVAGTTLIMYVFFFASIIECFFVWRKVKKQLLDAVDADEIPSRSWFYAYSRMIMVRPWRSPRPQVARGEFPHLRKRHR